MSDPGTAITIRPATPGDRAAIIRLLSAQMEDHALPFSPDGVARAVELALTPSSVAWLLIATASGLAAGVLLANPCVSVEKGGASMWIEELFVAPAFRRRGVARALMDHVIAEARNHGIGGLDLEVTPGHEAAAALYRRLGFQLLSRQRLTLEFGATSDGAASP